MAMATGSAIVTKFAKRPADGTWVADGVGVPFGNPNGSRIGITIHPSSSYDYYERCGSIELDCTTAQTSATPKYWTCQAVYQGKPTPRFVLVESDIARDPYCSIFQDGAAMMVKPPRPPVAVAAN